MTNPLITLLMTHFCKKNWLKKKFINNIIFFLFSDLFVSKKKTTEISEILVITKERLKVVRYTYTLMSSRNCNE